MPDTISERIKKGLKARDMKQSDLCRETDIGKSSISTYISGEYEPKQKNLYKIAKALNVSISWIMGEDVPMGTFETPEESQKVTDEDLKVALFKGAENVTDEMWNEVINFARYVEARESDKNKKD